MKEDVSATALKVRGSPRLNFGSKNTWGIEVSGGRALVRRGVRGVSGTEKSTSSEDGFRAEEDADAVPI